MATSTEIKQRANALADKTDVNSITPKEVGGIMYDLASHGENVLRNGGTLGIRKVYESVSAMEADSTNPKDFWGDPIKKGNLVVIYDGTTTGVENNKIYAFMKPGWELATKLDAAYATKAETDAKLSELGSKIESEILNFTLYGIYKEFPCSLKAGKTYRIRCTTSPAQYTDLYYRVSSGSTDVKIGSFLVSEKWSLYDCKVDSEYIYYGSAGLCKFEIQEKGAISDEIKDLNSDILNIKNDISIINEDAETLNKNIFGGNISVLLGTEYKNIYYKFENGKSYIIDLKKEGGGYVDIFTIDENGKVSSEKLTTISVGTPFKWIPDTNYYGIFIGNSGTTLSVYVKQENSISSSISKLTNSTRLYAYATEGTDDDTHFYGWKNGKCAIQRAIDSCDGTPTKIFCKGKFYANAASMFTYQANGYYNVVFVPRDKKNIEIIGEGADKTIIEVEMPDDFDNYATYQPLEVWGDNIIVQGIKIVSKNCRYCIHLDASGHTSANGHTIIFRDIHLFHRGNAKQSFETPLGLGISSGMKLYTERCVFETNRNYTPPLYLHDNIGFDEEFTWYIKDCQLLATAQNENHQGVSLINIQTLGSGVKGNIIIDNTDTYTASPIIKIENNNTTAKTNKESYDSNVFVRIKGNADFPVGYNVVNSTSCVLRITSKSKGTQSSVRFDTSSSAFGIIVKGLLPTDFSEKNGINHVNGYQYRDGVEGLSGYAMGELALDRNSICSLQNRLGDCSASPKVLGIVINGVSYSINFNKNYNNYTDADMLSEISNVVGSVANVELYNWGADYFPELKPVTIKRNKDAEVILKGMGVRIIGTDIFKAKNDDELNAIALEDILPLCSGRIATKCTLSIFENDHHHIALESYPKNDSDKYGSGYQGTFGIGNNAGVFVKKDGGKVKMVYWGYLTLE